MSEIHYIPISGYFCRDIPWHVSGLDILPGSPAGEDAVGRGGSDDPTKTGSPVSSLKLPLEILTFFGPKHVAKFMDSISAFLQEKDEKLQKQLMEEVPS